MSFRRASIWIGLVPILLVAGCRTSPLVPARTVRIPIEIDDPRATEALERHRTRVQTRTALRGLARVALEGPDFKLDRPQRIAVARPARLRFEVLGLFDQLAALLVTDGRRYGFFDASEGRVTRGLVTPSLLWELVRMDLGVEEVVGILLGAPMPSPGLARAAVWLEPDGYVAVAFAWPDPEAGRPAWCRADSERLRFDPTCFASAAALERGGEVYLFDERDRLRELRVLEADGSTRLRALFEDHAPLGEASAGVETAADGDGFARRVTIRSPQIETEARFVWKRVMLAPDLSDRLFEIPSTVGRGQGG